MTGRTAHGKAHVQASQIAMVLGAIALSNVLYACTTYRHHMNILVPASVNLRQMSVQSIAVSDFDGPEDSGKKMGELFTAEFAKWPHIKVVERSKLIAIENELALGMMGVLDERTAVKAGKVLGVDAILIGKVIEYSVKDEPYTRTEMETRYKGLKQACDDDGNCTMVPDFEQVPVVRSYLVRTGTVSISYRIIRAETGQIICGRQESSSYSHDSGKPFAGRGMGSTEVLTSLARAVVDKLVSDVLPSRVVRAVEFERGGWFWGDSAVKKGFLFVDADRPEDAVQLWESVVKSDPQNSSAYYNMGIAYELINEFEKAEQAYRAAEKIEPKPRYIQAVSQVRKAAERHRKLQEQMR